MPDFDGFIKKTKPTQGEMIYVMMCMNGPKNTLTGMKLHALLHALQTPELKDIAFKMYLEINEHEPSDTLRNTYYPQWRLANRAFLEAAERVRPGCVQTLDVFQNTDQWRAAKKRYADYRNNPVRTEAQSRMLDEDEQKYIKSHPGASNVREHIIDVTVTMLCCHMPPDQSLEGLRNHLFYDGSLTTLQGNALQVAEDLGFRRGSLKHFKFGPDELVAKFKKESPDEFGKCLEAVKSDAALAEEKAAFAVFHTGASDGQSKVMSVSPELPPALQDQAEVPSAALSASPVTTSPVLSDRMITSTPPTSPPLRSDNEVKSNRGSRKKGRNPNKRRAGTADSTRRDEHVNDFRYLTLKAATDVVYEKEGRKGVLSFVQDAYKLPHPSCQNCGNSNRQILQFMVRPPIPVEAKRPAMTPFASSAYMSSSATTSVQTSLTSRNTLFSGPPPTLPRPSSTLSRLPHHAPAAIRSESDPRDNRTYNRDQSPPVTRISPRRPGVRGVSSS